MNGVELSWSTELSVGYYVIISHSITKRLFDNNSQWER